GTKPDQFLTELRKRMILKQRIALLSLIFGLWMPLMAQQASYQQDKTGLTLQFTDPLFSIRQQIRIQPITAHIIHVRSQPIGSDIKPTQNLIIVDSLRIQPGEWTVEEAGDDLLIKTSAITASVSRQTGAVSFLDHAGKSLVEEVRRDAGTFRSAAYDGDAFFAVQQGFRLSPNEAVYGLGQHQNGIMNYRGRQVTLLQYNTDVAVPFLISTNQYGILWNNYSITRAGDIRPLQPLSALRLYSADGQPGWLTANYAMKDAPSQIILSRPESEIDYSYLTDLPKLPDSIDLVNALVSYEGAVESPYAGLHRLHIKYAGYLKVWVDGELREDRWRESWNAGSFELDLDMQPGKK